MAREDLIVHSPEEAQKMGSLGGKASAEARKKKKRLAECLIALLDAKHENEGGKKGSEVIATALFKKASKGDVKAFEVIRDTIGEKPKDDLRDEVESIGRIRIVVEDGRKSDGSDNTPE